MIPANPLNVVQHDIHLCAYSALLQIVAKFHDEIFSDPSTPSGLNKVCTKTTLFYVYSLTVLKNVDFRKITMKHDEYLTQYHEEWLTRFEESSDPNGESNLMHRSRRHFSTFHKIPAVFSDARSCHCKQHELLRFKIFRWSLFLRVAWLAILGSSCSPSGFNKPSSVVLGEAIKYSSPRYA